MPLTRTGYANFAAFPVTGVANIIYVDLSNGNEYTWSGSAYVAYTGTLAGVRLGNKSAAWFTANPNVLLGDGQLVYLNDNSGQFKKGDGVTVLSSLPFIGGGTSYTAGEEVDTDFTGTTFNLPNTPNFIYGVFVNGQRFTTTVDYSVSGNNIIFVNSRTNDSITVVYQY
jgi:hypothetical protein